MQRFAFAPFALVCTLSPLLSSAKVVQLEHAKRSTATWGEPAEGEVSASEETAAPNESSTAVPDAAAAAEPPAAESADPALASLEQQEATPHPTATAGAGAPPAAAAGAATAHHSYLFGGQKTTWGGYGGLHIKPSSVGRSAGMFVGGGGGLHFQTGLLGIHFGAAAYGLTLSSVAVDDGSGTRQNIDLGYGGVVLGLGYVAPRFFELGVRSLVGVGGLCVFGGAPSGDAASGSRRCSVSGALFVVEPELAMYVRFTQRFRLGLAGGYRFAFPPWESPDTRQLSGVGGTVGFEWGVF